MSRWFAHVGTPLARAESDALRALMANDALLAGAQVLPVATWQQATDIARAMDADALWWDHEEAERERLWNIAADCLGESGLLQRLSLVEQDHAAVRPAAAAAAARAGFTGAAAIRDAAGAVLLAAHQNALATLAGEGAGHAFPRKYAMFADGRWPLGYHLGRYAVF